MKKVFFIGIAAIDEDKLNFSNNFNKKIETIFLNKSIEANVNRIKKEQVFNKKPQKESTNHVKRRHFPKDKKRYCLVKAIHVDRCDNETDEEKTYLSDAMVLLFKYEFDYDLAEELLSDRESAEKYLQGVVWKDLKKNI